MTSGSGIIFRGLMDENNYSSVSFNYTSVIFIESVIFSLLLIVIFRFITQKNKEVQKNMVFEKPDMFTAKQKINLILIIIMIAVVLLFPILHMIFPASAAVTFLNSKIDVGLTAIAFSAVALFLKLAPQDEVIKKIPWNTIIMICGVGMLINVAIEAGTLDLMAAWAGSSLPVYVVPAAFSLIGAVMSFFSSTLGVVCPALFPLVPSLAAATGISPLIIFSSIVIGAQSSAISPFSSGGSLILGSCANEEERTAMFPRLLFVAVPVSVISATVFNVVASMLI